MSVEVSSGGLYGLVMKISDELKEGKTFGEVVSKYPIGEKTLTYLLTLQEECSEIFFDFVKEEYTPLEKENNALKEQIKRLESKKDISNGVDSQETLKELERLRNELKRLKNENSQLQKENIRLKSEISSLEEELKSFESDLGLFNSFFEKSPFCFMFYKNFLRKYSQGK